VKAQRKLFVGGLSQKTTEGKNFGYIFSNYPIAPQKGNLAAIAA
jgi:hypothetical protein